MAEILITGGTGMIGTALTDALLSEGHTVTIYTRSPQRNRERRGVRYARWSPAEGTMETEPLANANALIHLAGENIGSKRWTAKRKRELIESRQQAAGTVAATLRNNQHGIRVIVAATAIGWYGEKPEGEPAFIETDPPANDFLGTTCRLWEEAIEEMNVPEIRLVKLRTAMTLKKGEGAMKEFEKILWFRIVPLLAGGHQCTPWIDLRDLVQVYCKCIRDGNMRGVYNAVAPGLISNGEMMKTIARKIYGGYLMAVPVPAFVPQFIKGEVSVEVLKNAPVSCEKLLHEGFRFHYPTLNAALE